MIFELFFEVDTGKADMPRCQIWAFVAVFGAYMHAMTWQGVKWRGSSRGFGITSKVLSLLDGWHSHTSPLFCWTERTATSDYSAQMDTRSKSPSSERHRKRHIPPSGILYLTNDQPRVVVKGEDDPDSKDNKKRSVEGHVHDNISEVDILHTFGATGPRASFIPTSREQSRSNLSFTTARSSLASYVTASNSRSMVRIDPARSSGNILPRQVRVPEGNNSDETAQIWTLIEAIIQRLKQRTEINRLLSHQRQNLSTRKEAIYMDLVGHLGVMSAPRLDLAIQGVVKILRTMEQPYDNAFNIDGHDMKLDVAMEIYMYALKRRHLQHLVPSGVFTDGEMTKSQWILHLHSRGLLPSEAQALDWSGRGQHAEYLPDEEQLIPLVEGKVIGQGMSAVVQLVKCRRILLARKTVWCTRQLTKKMAVTEVQHLQSLQHQHIIRIVGTYTLKKTLAILLYPAAQWNLRDFLEEYIDVRLHGHDKFAPWRILYCLATAVAFIHACNVKHMDIKPANILVRYREDRIRIYIADFGIARAYRSAEESNTDSPMSFTRTYAAPEVLAQDARGFPADIFSLGCVYLEIINAILCRTWSETEPLSRELWNGDKSYSSNLDAVRKWCDSICVHSIWDERIPHEVAKMYTSYIIPSPDWVLLFKDMLDTRPEKRPSARDLQYTFRNFDCGSCGIGPEPFKAADAEIWYVDPITKTSSRDS